MIDCVNMYIYGLQTPPEVAQRIPNPIKFCELVFYPKYQEGEIKYYESTCQGLRLILTEATLKISNSLHKFLKEGNHSDFFYSDLILVIEIICERFNVGPEEIKVTSFEYGLNVNTELLPEEYYECMRNYDKKPLENMRGKNQIYGVKAVLCQYEFKIYNKTKEQAINGNKVPQQILRVELKIKSRQKTPFISTLADFVCKNNLKRLQQLLISSLEKFNVSHDYSELTPRQREFAYAGEGSGYWKLERKLNKNTAKKKRKDYNNLISSLNENPVIGELSELLSNKFKLLINS